MIRKIVTGIYNTEIIDALYVIIKTTDVYYNDIINQYYVMNNGELVIVKTNGVKSPYTLITQMIEDRLVLVDLNDNDDQMTFKYTVKKSPANNTLDRFNIDRKIDLVIPKKNILILRDFFKLKRKALLLKKYTEEEIGEVFGTPLTAEEIELNSQFIARANVLYENARSVSQKYIQELNNNRDKLMQANHCKYAELKDEYNKKIIELIGE